MRIESILRAIKSALEDTGIKPVYLRRLSAIDNREGMVVRPAPLIVRASYIDGSSDVELPVRVICKRRESSRAMALAEDAADALHMLQINDGEDTAIIQASEERAREIELSDAGFSVWEAQVTASFEVNN